jgi:hypothetical protein
MDDYKFVTNEFGLTAFLMQYFTYDSYSGAEVIGDYNDKIRLYYIKDPTNYISTQEAIDGYVSLWNAADPATYQIQTDLLTEYTK